ncbi:ankyrin repeat protein [Fowlpox virus]|nr:ankyrin repeat protein [Fowlpox virus]
MINITTIINNYIILLCRIIYTCYYVIKNKGKLDRSSMLYSSIKFYYHDVTAFMLNIGTSPEVAHPSFRKRLITTPLIYSIDYNNDVAVELLLSYGANVDRYTQESKITPVYVSVLYTRDKCLDILLKYYPNINSQVDDKTPLELALLICYSYTYSIVKGDELLSFYNHKNRYSINLSILYSLVSYFILYKDHNRNKNIDGWLKNKSLILRSVILRQFKNLCETDIRIMKSIRVKNYSNSLISFFDIFVNNDSETLLNNLDDTYINDLPKNLQVYNNKVKTFLESVNK